MKAEFRDTVSLHLSDGYCSPQELARKLYEFGDRVQAMASAFAAKDPNYRMYFVVRSYDLRASFLGEVEV
jgi:hypothetical protein